VNKQKDRHLFKQYNRQKSVFNGGFLFVILMLAAASVLRMAVLKTEAASGINRQINYQGRLMDGSGINVGDGNYQMRFSLYTQASGGSPIWSASTTNGLPTGTPADVSVNVKSGLFTVLLGDTSAGQVPLDIDWNQDALYLGVKVGADSEMSPRKRLTAVPYALNAEMLQGQHASSSISNTGGNLFALNQASNDAATALRTALFVETQGTSNVYDYLLRMSDGTSDVFTVNRQGNATTTGYLAIGDYLKINGIRLDAVGSNPLTSGAYLVGVYDEFTFSSATTVQAALKDLDTAIGNVSSSAMGLTLQDVTNNGNTTTNPLIFAGGTSTASLYPSAHLTYNLGGQGRRWYEVWTRFVRLGASSWTLGEEAGGDFYIADDLNGERFRIDGLGNVGIGTSTPSAKLEVEGDSIINGTLQFEGGTSTGNLMPGAHLTYDLGGPGRRWDEIWIRRTRIGTDSWTIETDSNNTFLISEDTFGNYFAITEDGRVGIGTSTPSLFDLEVNGTIGPSQHNLYDLGSLTSSWRNILASGTVSSTDAIFGSADIGSLSVTTLTIDTELDLSNLIWLNATGTNSILGNLTVTSTLSLPNDSVTDAMASDTLTIGALGNVSATSINSGVLGNANVVLSLDSFGSITGSLPASQISLASINTPNNLDLQSYLNMLVANGRAYGGETIQTASGTVMVTAGQGLIASDPTNPGANVYYTAWATSSGISVPFFEWFNIYLHYNAGNPSIVATTTDYSGDWTYYKLAKVYNEGDGYLHIHDERSIETRPINRIVDFLENGVGQIVTDGCIISDVGTRNIAVSQCTNWYAAFERIIPAFDSSGADSFDIYYRNGSGGFVHAHGFTQWNNLNYDNNSGVLQALAGDEYGVHWVYIHEHGSVSLLYGQAAYTDLANAQSARPPDILPEDFLNSEHAFLIGAIIFKQGQDSVEAIRDLRPVIIDRDGNGAGSGIVNHNDLSGLQGGQADEYYHLTASGFNAENSLNFSSNNGGAFTLLANATTNTKITIDNTFAGTASLDIIDGDLLLASTTRITNSGAAFFTNLNLSSNLYVSGTSLLTTLTVGDVTSTNLFASSANFTNASAGLLNATDLFWTNATGTNAFITKLTGNQASFTDLTATNATFTQLVVMDNTTIQNLTFSNATGGNLVTYGTVSSTFINVAQSILGYATAHNMIVDESLRVGIGDFPIVGDSVAQFGGTVDSYLQVNLQNHSSGTNASGDYIVTADIGDDSNYYVDLGINSSNYSNPDFSITGPLDAYLYANSANLTIGTATASSAILFHAGGTELADEVMRITADHYVGIGTTTPSHTLDVDGDGRFTGLLTLSSATTSELFWGDATGTSLYVTGLARLPANTMIGGISVCLLDGTNCPSSTSPDLHTVTNTGNTTTNWLQFAGGTSTADFWFQQDVRVDGNVSSTSALFVNATGTNLILSGLVSSTSLISGDAVLANTIMQNATATNLNIETLKVGSGDFPVLGASIAQFGGDFNNYLVVNARNTNAGNFATANFVASADVATPGNNFNTALGIANSGFNSPFFTIANPLDSYLMGNSSDLIIVAATSSSVIKFAVGGTLANNEVMRITSDQYVGIGTTTPSHTLDVDGDGRFTGLLTLSSATTSELFWGDATGTKLYVTNLARLPSNTMIGGVNVCLLDGTNCPSSTSPDLQTVTNTGNTTTNWLQFAGGTSTADFWMQQNLIVSGNVSSTSALFINATGTYVDFITTADNPAYFEGRLFYDKSQAALSYYNEVSEMTVNLAEESIIKVYNDSGSVITNGQVVYITGADNDGHPTIELASAASSSTARIMGMATHDIGIGDHGYITRFGKVHFLDTSSFASGTSLYLSAVTPGYYTAIRPESPGITVEIGVVVQSHATEGIILVSLGSPRNGRISDGGVVFGTSNDFMTDDADNFYWNNTSKRLGLGTDNPSSTLHVVGTTQVQGIQFTHATGNSMNISGLIVSDALTVNTATSSNLIWTNATGTSLRVTGPTRLSSDTRINGILPCLADGTNCPSAAAATLQTVTNAGNTTTHDIQFAGGTSTANFRFQQDVWIDGNVSSTSALFINATGTNLAVLGYINSNLSPAVTDTYALGDATHRWQGLVVNYVTSTNVLATGYVSSSAMYINGQAVTTSVPTLNQVTTQGNVTANAIQFGGGTSTGSILPGTTDLYNLGSASLRWNNIYGNSLLVGTSTPWSLTELSGQQFAVSNNGNEKMRVDNAGNLLFATTTYTSGLDSTFVLSGNDAYYADKLGVGGSLYAGTDLRVGATSTIYGKSSLYKQDSGDYLFQFADVAASQESISGFEGSFPPAGWTTGGNANWLQDASTSTEGTYSATNGDITDNQISWMEITYNFTGNGVLEFDWRVSSEVNYDYLMVCIDNSVNCSNAGGGYYSRISGETNFATVSIPISAGLHTIRWAYDKDISISEGSDAGWVDNVIFTPYSGQNWRFYTASIERLTIAYSGNVGVGISDPEAKLDINGETKARGNVTITPAPSKTEVSWTTANIPATGIESVRALAVFNGYLYAGQGDSAGDGDIQVCNPAGGGDTTLCDNAADWSASYSGATYSQVLSLLVYKGRLYAGMGNGAGLGDVMVCNPVATGNADVCDAGDWSDAVFPAGPARISQLIEFNGYLYASNDTGVAGSASVGVCNPAGGGVATACDNAADWTNVALPVAGFERANALAVYLGRLYAFTGQSTDDSDTFYCEPDTAGDIARCDAAGDWTRPFNNTAGTYETIEEAVVYNGYLYISNGTSNADGDIQRCEPQAAGNDLLCDNAGDFSTVIDNGGQITRVPAMQVYDGSLFLGYEGGGNDGDIVEYRVTDPITSDAGTGFEATYSFAELNGVLYAGRGNASGNGQVYYYQKARESSYALKMEAGSSTGSMWFSSESLNYQGAGTGYDAQTGAFKFSHGLITEAGAYDLAEMYPTLDASITAGDVVVLDAQNAGYVKKSEASYEKSLLGVVSAKPGFLLSGKEKGQDLRAIALVGRVPVKVSLENGEVAVGDPLTSASISGYAMKATKPGMIIGHALESFSSSTQDAGRGTSDALTGTVMMVVQTGYYFGSQDSPLGQIAGFLGETTSTQIIQQAFNGDAYAIEQVMGGLINPQVADGSSINNVSSAQLDVLIVRTAALIAGDLTVGGDVRLMGRVIVSENTAGVVDVPAGQAWVEIVFKTPFDEVPVVVVTPESDAEEYFTPWLGRFRIAKKTKEGFRIEVDEGSCLNPADCGRTMKFNWMAVGVQSQALSLDEEADDNNASDTTTTTAIGDNPESEQVVEPENSETQIISEPETLPEQVVEPADVVDPPLEEAMLPVVELDTQENQSDDEQETEAIIEPLELPEVIIEPEIIESAEGGEGT